ncbi:hypothetical protein ACIRPT_39585 [Streptomyces sp. NPDC101227]|uniref:hypothetical protein n=1 Tax=Streptomyces sp. NPDC101227 TaxID=3366136 RepID=UPI0038009867
MFSRKKIAAVSGLLGGLAMTCAGVTQAYAGGSVSDCARSALGNRVCIHKGQHVYKSKNGSYVIKQSKDCTTISRQRLLWPEDALLNGARQSTKIGPAVSCSNRVHLPKHFKLPHIGF